jgi:hypothetical protein
MVTMEQESFLVFPTSSEHRKELEFFLNSLLAEIFSVEYFEEVYLNQFLKVLKSLLKQLIALKGFNRSGMQIFSVDDLKAGLNGSKHPTKLVFLPVAERGSFRDVLNEIKTYVGLNPDSTVIILNIFCEMNVPSYFYRQSLSNVILINLFVIANERRFRENLNNNVGALNDDFGWFTHNR